MLIKYNDHQIHVMNTVSYLKGIVVFLLLMLPFDKESLKFKVQVFQFGWICGVDWAVWSTLKEDVVLNLFLEYNTKMTSGLWINENSISRQSFERVLITKIVDTQRWINDKASALSVFHLLSFTANVLFC
jgi:hypothetical protein